MRAAAKDQAELIAISYAERTDLTYGSDEEMEKAYLQYVSGWMFGSFGLRPALGRLFTENDDLKPGAHPYAVLSYDYWTRRFGQDPKVVGRTFRMGNDLYEIVGVGPEHFTGTEPGTMIDIFVPTMMHPGAVRPDWTWHANAGAGEAGSCRRTSARQTGTLPREPSKRRGRRGSATCPRKNMDEFLNQKLLLEPAAAGVSDLQNDYRTRARGSRGPGGAGAADCLRQRRQPDDGSGGGAGARDGAARFDRRRTMAPGATGAGGKRLAGVPRRRDRRVVRLVVRAVRRQHDQSAGQSGAPVSSGGLARAGIRPGADPRRDVPVRSGARAARLGRASR